MTDRERKLAEDLKHKLSQGLGSPQSLKALQAAMLYYGPHQLPPRWYEGAAIPSHFLDQFIQFSLETPSYYQEIGEAQQYCHFLRGWVDYVYHYISNNPNSNMARELALKFSKIANFIPIYFNYENLKNVYIQRARIMEFALAVQGCQLDYQFPQREANRNKIRLGVYSYHFNPLTETFATLPVFEYLDRDQFEIILYSSLPSETALADYCKSRADRFVQLPQSLNQQASTLRSHDLDILLIGSNVTAVSRDITFLAMHRLARIQVTSVCSCVTTGMKNIDYYISGNLTEPEQAQDQYYEKLLTIDGPAHCFNCDAVPTEPPKTYPTRESLGIARDTILFTSGANFYKVIPELRENWAKILSAVPNSVLLLYPFNPNWSSRYHAAVPFIKNFKSILSRYNVAPSRLKILPTLPNRSDIREYIKLADIYLDSYPFSGVTSLLDPLEVGLPPIVQDGNSFRTSMGAAFLRAIDLNDLISSDEQSYIDLAIRLATQPQLRQHYCQLIQQRMGQNPPFLDSRTYSAKIGELFKHLFQEWQMTQASSSPKVQLFSTVAVRAQTSSAPSPPSHSPASPPEDEHPSSQAFINRTISYCNIYHIDPTEQPIIEELRQLRRHLVDYWLTWPSDQLDTAYNGEIGKAFKALLNSDFQKEPLSPEEQQYRQKLTQQGAGLVKPQALNALMGAMLYYPADEMKVRDAKTRLPDWLYPDYEAVFEAEATPDSAAVSPPASPAPTPQSPIIGATAPPQAFSPALLRGLEEAVTQYKADPTHQEVILKLRNLRHQLILNLASQPLERVAVHYGGELGRVYKKLLRSGFQKQPLGEIEVQTRDKLAEAWKNRHHQEVNAMMGLFLYFPPGTMKIQEATARLPDWLYEEYRAVFEAALPAPGVPKPVSSEQLPPPQRPVTLTTPPLPDYPVASPTFLNRLLGTVNLYQIDPKDATVVAELRQIRRQFVDYWLTLPQAELERIYFEDLGRGYRILLTSGLQKEALTPEEQAYRQELTQKGAGLTEPQSLNALMGAMLYYPTDQLRVQEAATRLPGWLLEDYEAVFEGKVKASASAQPPSSEFVSQVSEFVQRLRQNPNDGAALVRLRQARQQLCQYWLSLPAEQLPGVYAGPMGEVQRLFMNSGMQQLAKTAAEQSLFEQLGAELSQGMNRPKSLQCFLAAMLICRADQLRVSSAHGLLPTWLIGDYERVFLVK